MEANDLVQLFLAKGRSGCVDVFNFNIRNLKLNFEMVNGHLTCELPLSFERLLGRGCGIPSPIETQQLRLSLTRTKQNERKNTNIMYLFIAKQ